MQNHWTTLFDRKGFQVALARRFGLSRATVNEWRVKGIPVPYCAGVEDECEREFTRRDFRPDDWQRIWPELAALPTPAPAEQQEVGHA